jgi:hypothetical protein
MATSRIRAPSECRWACAFSCDFSKPPLHTLPHDELIAKLKTLTNLRVIRDEDSATGWKLTHDPFPGLGDGAHLVT